MTEYENAIRKLAEQKKRIQHLEREADWLAKRFNICPVDIIGVAGMCRGTPINDEQCIQCWRKAARKAIEDDK